MKTGIELIAKEREKQLQRFGSPQEHDYDFEDGQLICAAAYALLNGNNSEFEQDNFIEFEENVLRDRHDPIANLIKAGALIAAEIDRLIATKYK